MESMKYESGLINPRTIVKNDVVDSTRWNEFSFRESDVVVATFGKTGTTWVQQIVGQLIFQGSENVSIGAISPWIEYRGNPWPDVQAALQRQTHRRFVKTHLPHEALPHFDKAYYIYVARDARDQIWSAYNHLVNLNAMALLPKKAGDRDLGKDELDVRTYYHELLDRDGPDAWPYWSHVLSWWNARHLPNVLLVHFARLKTDIHAEIMRIAEFLGINAHGDVIQRVIEHTSFEYMKRNAENIVGTAASPLRGGPSTLINLGTNGRWASVLSNDEVAKCDRIAARHLPRDCAHWLSTGAES
jgi:aryl sulfotransferase